MALFYGLPRAPGAPRPRSPSHGIGRAIDVDIDERQPAWDWDLDELPPLPGPSANRMPGFFSESPPPPPQRAPTLPRIQRPANLNPVPLNLPRAQPPVPRSRFNRQPQNFRENDDGVIVIDDSDSDDGIEFVGFGRRPAPPPPVPARLQRRPVPAPVPARPPGWDGRNLPNDILRDRHSPERPHPDGFQAFLHDLDFDIDLPGPSRNAPRPANRNVRAATGPRRERIFSPPPPLPQFHQIPPVPPLPPQHRPNNPPPPRPGFFGLLPGGGLAAALRDLWSPVGNHDRDAEFDDPFAAAAAPARPQPLPRIRLGGGLFRGAQRQVFLLGGNPGGVDREGWQRYDPALFGGQQEPPAAPPLNPKETYHREWVFKRSPGPGETNDLEEPEPPKKVQVIDLTDRKGKRKAVEIESDNEDDKPSKRLIVCAGCSEQLVGESGQRDAGDRVFALRCGHVIDGRCMHRLSEDPSVASAFPFVEFEAPKAPPASNSKRAPRRKAARGRGRKAAPPPPPVDEVLILAEREWKCPVKGCERVHTSQYVQNVTVGTDGSRTQRKPSWAGKANQGPIPIFV